MDSAAETDGGIAASIDPAAVIDFASSLITIPSFKAGGETQLARWLDEFFRARGYEVTLQEVEPGRFQTIAVLPGKGHGGRTLMLNGHLDIDPLAAGWRRDPWKPSLEGDRLYGAGVRNMKGGLSALIAAAEAVRVAQRPRQGDLIVACVLGELQGGVGTVAMLEEGVTADAAIVAEPMGKNLVTTHAGVLEFALSTVGRSVHVSRKKSGKDALQAMIRLINALGHIEFRCTPRADLPDLPILNVGGIIGGRGRDYNLRGPNFICDYCTALVDIRFLPGQSAESVLQDVRTCLSAAEAELDGVEWEISLESKEPFAVNTAVFEPTEIPPDCEIVEMVAEEFTRQSGHSPHIGVSLPGSYAGADTAHLWRAGIPCLMYGPGGGPVAGDDEVDDYIDVEEMTQCARVVASVADRYCR